MEGLAARYAADNIRGEELTELQALHARRTEIVDPEEIGEYRELNRRFHSILFAASRRLLRHFRGDTSSASRLARRTIRR